jgi:16S rRNA G966 N2-methylase RsmD
MERNRSRALDLYARSFDLLEEARKFAALAAISGKTESRHSPGQFTDQARDAIAPHYGGSHVAERRARFLDEMTQQTDRSMWSHIIQATDLERLMDKKARDEFRDSLAKSPPPALAENVRATLSAFLEDADTIFRRGIAVAFSSLDRRFKSHDGFKIGARVVLPYMFNVSGGWNHHARQDETLRDIERTFCVLDGKPHPERAAGICGQVDGQGYFSTQWTIEGDYFRIRRFKNGNAHLWFTRPDLVRRVNRLLADYYGEAIGEGSEVADVSDMGPSYHVTPAKNFGLFESPADVVDRVFDRTYQIEGKRLLEPSAGSGRLADEARRRGADVQCVEIQTGLAAQLRAKGHKVTQGDFLAMSPAELGQFDVVAMNPPFDRGRDCDHVRHALKFLKPGGRLVSVMSASAAVSENSRAASFRAMIDKLQPPGRWGDERWQDLPAGSFKESGTMVNTCILAVTAPA